MSLPSMSHDLSHSRLDLWLGLLVDKLYVWATPAWALSPTMQAIRGGFVLCLPLVVTGALAVLLNNLPLDAYQELMLS
ncbi:MAG: hypothetical protein LBB51_03745, partial [Zoogloeaceae bacterium]|nr:hypothetical protein [Zoogloeaceae bacterium]